MSKVPFKPAGYNTVCPYLIIKGASEAIEFYKKLFGAEEVMRFDTQGIIGHAELQIGDSRIMLADEHLDWGVKGPEAFGGCAVGLSIYVEDVDTIFNQAKELGCQVLQEPKDQFYGDRNCRLKDPFGHEWAVATHIEEISPEEMKKRAKELFG